jgi:hypothetical protein
MSRRHEISSAPEHMVWGYLDSTIPPVLEIDSGDIVTLHSFSAASGGRASLVRGLRLGKVAPGQV